MVLHRKIVAPAGRHLLNDSQKTKTQLVEELRELRQQLTELQHVAGKQKILEEALRQSDARCQVSLDRFRKIFEHSNDAIFIVDPSQDEIVEVNSKACRMLGYPREELLSVPMSVIHRYELDKVKLFAQSVFKEGKGWTDELTCTTKTGTLVSAEMSASIVELDGRDYMIALVRDVTERERLARENEYLQGEIRAELGFGSIVGTSSAMDTVLEQVKLVAPTDASVLIKGESGTGKELIARAIHGHSKKSEEALVRVNCAAVPSELFESEFFGHVQGAFTGAFKDRTGRFQLADGGTLFLDEVSEIPMGLQSKLLRVLQEGEFERVGEEITRKVDVRIIAASNRDLLAETKTGKFREDMYYRLSVFVIEIPPLRDRPEDIGPLAQHFVHDSSGRLGVAPPRITKTDIRVLQQYTWPGNVRELHNVVERAVILAKGRRLQFDLRATREPMARPQSSSTAESTAEDLSLVDIGRMERDVIVNALERSEWRIYGKSGAAKLLGLKPTTLSSKMKKMGISKPR